MATCANCEKKWKTKEVRALFKAHNGMECPYCYRMQYFSEDTAQFMIGGSILGMGFLLLFPNFVNLSNTSGVHDLWDRVSQKRKKKKEK